jgi:type II secretory pathway pseudopilin PulG
MRRQAAAFTLVELVTVIGIILLLAGLTLPAITGAMRRQSVDNACRTLIEASRVAADLACRTNPPPSGAVPFFGVAIDANADGSEASVVVTWGTTYPPTPAQYLRRKTTEWFDWTEYGLATDMPGSPAVWRRRLPSGVTVHMPVGDPNTLQPVSAAGWLHQYRTGWPIAAASLTATGQSIGVSPDPLLVLRTGQMASAVAIYDFGLGHVALVQ